MEEKKLIRQWQPVLTGNDAEEALNVVDEIANALHRPPAAWIPREIEGVEPFRLTKGASLVTGSSGIALFFAYLAQASKEPSHFAEEADCFISQACDILEIVPMQGSLLLGLSGIAWVVQHLHGILYDIHPDAPAADPNEEIDRLLLEHAVQPEGFDLWKGSTGLGVYALERFSYPTGKQLLERMVRQLQESAVSDEDGITWFTAANPKGVGTASVFSSGYYDLGVAHGTAGVISFLSCVYALEVLPGITGKLLYGAVSWLMAQQWEHEDGSVFPQYILPPDNRPITTGTYGYCHGDLGVAAALVSAASCLGEESWKNKAVEAANASVRYLKKAAATADFSDPGICHGTAGYGHLFNRIYQATGIDEFKEAARKWFRHTLAIRRPGHGIAGYSKVGMNEEREMSRLYDPGFAQGAAGVGLSLLAAATSFEPKWDRVLLLSPTMRE